MKGDRAMEQEIRKLIFRFASLILALKERSPEEIIRNGRDMLSRQLQKVIDEFEPRHVLAQLNNSDILREWVVETSILDQIVKDATNQVGPAIKIALETSDEEIDQATDEVGEYYHQHLTTIEAEEYANSVLK